MPRHAVRHTAAAWLAACNSLTYAQRQLGHSDTANTAHCYGRLACRTLVASAAATEEAIARAAARQQREAPGSPADN